jgi:AcrR family transcriptional regulator
MAYTVTKTIRGRQYLYRVESLRDPSSGKSRNRWTYLGRQGPADAAPAPRGPRRDTRARLLAALEGLLERVDDADDITADAIARAAGVAHGTFYRYFRDRAHALTALVEQLRETHGASEERLHDDVATLAEARAGVRAWIEERLRLAIERPDLVRSFLVLMTSDPKLAAYRRERRERVLGKIRTHFEVLVARGFAQMRDPAATARALNTMLDGYYRAAISEGEPLDLAHIASVIEVAERAVFGS